DRHHPKEIGAGELDGDVSHSCCEMSILIGFICLLLSVFLVSVSSPRKTPNLFLAAFLALTAIELSVWLWGPSSDWTWLAVFWMALGRLQMPVFFLFFVSSCYSDFRLKPHDLLHLVPFGLTLVLNGPGAPHLGALSDVFTPGTRPAWLFLQVWYFGYMIAIVALLWRFRTRFQRHYAGAPSEVLIWLTQLAAASLLARAIQIVRDGVSFASASPTALGLQMASALLALAITSWIALNSLLKPRLFRDVDRRLMRIKMSAAPQQPNDVQRLIDYVETERPFLDPELTLATLADRLAMTPRELSELLNGSLGVHFFDFVNSHRIAYAQRLLVEQPHRSVLQVLLESGFNSKSSFNTAFKKQVGLTPSAFRAQSTASR
ncbi:MAG: helix-turn-helix domain-containing protein, partial [Pseudomonadota bacterium]